MNNYWHFSAGTCWVSNTIKEVPATDTVNKVFNNGDRTYESTHIRPLTKEKYHERYCSQLTNGEWLYDPDKPQPLKATHWYFAGADCYVPIDVYSVTAMDSYNSHYQDGSETELYMDCPAHTVDEYHTKFCTQQSDGKWYYNK